MEKYITPKDLLNKILYFKYLNGFKELENEQIENMPILSLLLKQLEVLFEVYQLGKVKDFENFNFIFERDDNDFVDLYNLVAKEIDFDNIPDVTSIFIYFDELLSYRSLIYRLTQNFSSVLSGNTLIQYLYSKHIKIMEGSKNYIDEIDECLCLIISPEQKRISLKELINNYNYPDTNIDDLYLDNW